MPIVAASIVLSRHEYAEKFEYDLELAFDRSDDDLIASPVRGKSLLDLDALDAARFDDAYEELLTKMLFADSNVESYFDRIWTIAQALDAPLRVQLAIEPDAPELHAVQWERLLHPGLRTPLTLTPNVYFSRLIKRPDLRFEGLRSQSFRRAIVLVANPRGLEQYVVDGERLAAIDVAAEIERAKKGLGELYHEQLSGAGNATLNRLMDKLRDGYDILYLVCHGAMVDGSPYLWLEDEQGEVSRTPGRELVQRLSELQYRPRLIVLASCQSAGTGEKTLSSDEGALSALGPLLAAMGIPAVLAMQGNVTMATLKEFMPEFFKEVRTNGQLDQAMASARQKVQKRLDCWMPVLFMRLKSGNIWWYRPGFAEPNDDLDKWPELLINLREGNCTPILGSGLTEFLFGSRRELAIRWADEYSFPLAQHQREDLAQVAQFLAVTLSFGFPQRELLRQLHKEVLQRHQHELPAGEAAPLQDLMLRLWQEQTARNPAEPHKILARLPLPIYITTNPDALLVQALASEGKEPRTGVFWWHEDREPPDSIFLMEPNYVPVQAKPLVYHFFGNLQETKSLVVTEDNFFDFLIASGRHSTTIMPRVRRYLTDASLLFLGFRLDQWEFRVLFRSIMKLTGGGRIGDYAHVAVQIDPAESGLHNKEEVTKFFKKFFQNASVSVFWGSVEDFTQQLCERWLATYNVDLRK